MCILPTKTSSLYAPDTITDASPDIDIVLP